MLTTVTNTDAQNPPTTPLVEPVAKPAAALPVPLATPAPALAPEVVCAEFAFAPVAPELTGRMVADTAGVIKSLYSTDEGVA